MDLVEFQETIEKYTSTQLSIKGDYADIEVKIDEYGDIELL